jgi:hypothetical protein
VLCCAVLCRAVCSPRGPLDAAGGSVAIDFKSYEGGLLPTPSMPMGQIPHALVVPYSELQLEDLIGAGAEGKVRGFAGVLGRAGVWGRLVGIREGGGSPTPWWCRTVDFSWRT